MNLNRMKENLKWSMRDNSYPNKLVNYKLKFSKSY